MEESDFIMKKERQTSEKENDVINDIHNTRGHTKIKNQNIYKKRFLNILHSNK